MSEILALIRQLVIEERSMGELIGYCSAHEPAFLRITERLCSIEMRPTITSIGSILVALIEAEEHGPASATTNR